MLSSWKLPIALLHARHHRSPHTLKKRSIVTPVKTVCLRPIAFCHNTLSGLYPGSRRASKQDRPDASQRHFPEAGFLYLP
jgi:hypothetical protein